MEFLRGPEKSEPIVRTRQGGRTAGPNPFLDEGLLVQSYDTGETYSVVVAGGWEETQKMVREDGALVPAFDENGAPVMVEKLIGDAATAVALLRRAADYLEIGVSIDCVPAVGKNGRTLKGQVEVKYLGKERKSRRSDAQRLEEIARSDEYIEEE